MTMNAPLSLADAMETVAIEIDAQFDRVLTLPGDPRDLLYEAMRHAAIGGGKRLRPLLVYASSMLFNVGYDSAMRAGLAIECIHVYSLIHDDLPCMDDDDMRRGKPTVHRQYGEAIGVLAGDALHALAFEVAADPATHPDPFVRAELGFELARASGPSGMAGGQMMDLAAEESAVRPADHDAAAAAQDRRADRLLPRGGRDPGSCPARGPAVVARLCPRHRARLPDRRRPARRGRRRRRRRQGDRQGCEAGKATFVSLLGVERARAQAGMLVDQAIAHLAAFGSEADLLRRDRALRRGARSLSERQ